MIHELPTIDRGILAWDRCAQVRMQPAEGFCFLIHGKPGLRSQICTNCFFGQRRWLGGACVGKLCQITRCFLAQSNRYRFHIVSL